MATGSALVFVHEGQLEYEGFNTGIMFEENCKSHNLILEIYLLSVAVGSGGRFLCVRVDTTLASPRHLLFLMTKHVTVCYITKLHKYHKLI